MTEAIARLKNISGQGINDESKKVFEQIRNHRNKLVHFFHSAQGHNAGSAALGNVTAEMCLEWFHLSPLLSRKWGSHLASYAFEFALIDETMHRNRAFLQVKYDARSKDMEQGKAGGALFVECPSCGKEAMRKVLIAGPVVSVDCLVCRAAVPGLEIKCPGCRVLLRGHLYMGLPMLEVHHTRGCASRLSGAGQSRREPYGEVSILREP